MKRATLLVAVLAVVLVGCATFTSAFRSGGDARFKSGIQALSNGDYATARSDLTWVSQHYAADDQGQRALLILAALEMDPRNPTRRMDVGADLAASFLRLPERDKWVDPVAQTIYLLDLELGAAEQRAEAAEAAQRQSRERELPKLPGPSVTARLQDAEQQRDQLAKKVSSLEAQLADKERELERIRKTIKP